jgi:two-component system NarL family response regulator
MISINETDEDIHMALSAGARGYVPKSHDQDVIIRAIRTVVAGGKFLPPELETRLRERNRSVSLSHRELEVLGMIAKGKANKEIADGLKLSNNTVKTHVARILEKLGACDRTRAVTIAIQRGLLRL